MCKRVPVHRLHICSELGADLPVGAHAEGSHPVVELLGIVDELGLVHQRRDRLEDRRGQFDAHAQVDRVPRHAQAEAFRNAPQPARALPSGRDDDGIGLDPLAAAQLYPGCPSIRGQDVRHRCPGADRHPSLGEVIPHAPHDLCAALGADVADRNRHKAQARHRCPLFEPFDRVAAPAIDGSGRAILDIDPVDLVYQAFRITITPDLWQVAAYLRREGQLAVRERTCASPSGQDPAGLAIQAFASRLPRWAVPLLNVRSLIEDQEA